MLPFPPAVWSPTRNTPSAAIPTMCRLWCWAVWRLSPCPITTPAISVTLASGTLRPCWRNMALPGSPAIRGSVSNYATTMGTLLRLGAYVHPSTAPPSRWRMVRNGSGMKGGHHCGLHARRGRKTYIPTCWQTALAHAAVKGRGRALCRPPLRPSTFPLIRCGVRLQYKQGRSVPSYLTVRFLSCCVTLLVQILR